MSDENSFPIKKSNEEWKKELTEEQYRVTREEGTEPAFSGEYHDCKKEGTYMCSNCGKELFESDAKFDSGTGWPSFDKMKSNDAIGTKEDNKLLMNRTEVHCNNCGAHLGHVFDDGPTNTGKRYCINSLSLKLKEKSP